MLHPWRGGVKGMNVNLRSFGNCRPPARNYREFPSEEGKDKIDYKKAVVKYIIIFTIHMQIHGELG
jgi:hypothetical protein